MSLVAAARPVLPARALRRPLRLLASRHSSAARSRRAPRYRERLQDRRPSSTCRYGRDFRERARGGGNRRGLNRSRPRVTRLPARGRPRVRGRTARARRLGALARAAPRRDRLHLPRGCCGAGSADSGPDLVLKAQVYLSGSASQFYPVWENLFEGQVPPTTVVALRYPAFLTAEATVEVNLIAARVPPQRVRASSEAKRTRVCSTACSSSAVWAAPIWTRWWRRRGRSSLLAERSSRTW